MTPKEKADKLINKFSPRCSGMSQTLLNHRLSIGTAIAAVEEILNLPISWMKEQEEIEAYGVESTYAFWEEVMNDLKSRT